MKKTGGRGRTSKHAGSSKHAHHHAKHHPRSHKKTPAAQGGSVHTVARHPHHGKGRGLALGDGVACCSAEALAASLRLAGWPVGDGDVLALYRATAGDDDTAVSILATLEAAAVHGVAGLRPVWFGPVDGLADGVIAGTTLPGGPHAVTIQGPGVWTWGEWHPFECGYLAEVEEAWAVRWPPWL